MVSKMPLKDWLNNLLEVPSKAPELIERTACANCKWREKAEDEFPCNECDFNLGAWEFSDNTKNKEGGNDHPLQ